MGENPWVLLPAVPPYVLPGDKADVEKFNRTAGPNYFLHIDKLLPEAFVGAADAPVILLSNNPGYSEAGVAAKQEPTFVAKMRGNLLHDPVEYPHVYLAPDFQGRGRVWWERRVRHLLKRFERRDVARSILNVPYFPYPSRRCCHKRLQLASQDYSFKLMWDAMKRNAVLIHMRRESMWLKKIPERPSRNWAFGGSGREFILGA